MCEPRDRPDEIARADFERARDEIVRKLTIYIARSDPDRPEWKNELMAETAVDETIETLVSHHMMRVPDICP